MSNIYDFFDDIVCINLNISKERKLHCQNVFKKLNIPARFFTAQKHPYGGFYGCFHSHIEVVKSAYERGLDNILVFEDDVLPSPSYSEEKLAKAIEFLISSEEWDVFYLGYSFMFETYETGFTSIVSHGIQLSDDIMQYNAGTAVAICYSRRAMKRILETYEDYIGLIHYDQYLCASIDLKNYCIMPIIFQQNYCLDFNIESQHGMEYIVRNILYPIDARINFTYCMSLMHYNYIMNAYRRYYKYVFLITVSMILHIIKRTLVKKIVKYNIVI